jgi:hypothetical protein
MLEPAPAVDPLELRRREQMAKPPETKYMGWHIASRIRCGEI